MPGVFQFSQTAANNATAVPSINWQENQAPSSINDSSRAEMAAVACYRDDISGSIVTSGISTAFVLTSNQGFGSSAAGLNNQVIAFSPHVTSGASPTLIVDGIGPFPIQSAPNVSLPAGVLIQGTPYVCIFNQASGAFFLQSFYGNPFNIPLAGGMPYFAPTPPNSAFAFPFGQAASRTGATAPLFALIGTTYGPGDGSTTFNLPDVRGRVLACLDNAGGTPAGRMTAANGFDGTILGNGGGSQTETLTLEQLPTGITSSNTAAIAGTITGTATSIEDGQINNSAGADTAYPTNQTGTNPSPVTMSVSGTASIPIGNANVTSNNTGGSAHPNVQPTFMANLIMRII
jgi:microcystin-dependent protein